MSLSDALLNMPGEWGVEVVFDLPGDAGSRSMAQVSLAAASVAGAAAAAFLLAQRRPGPASVSSEAQPRQRPADQSRRA